MNPEHDREVLGIGRGINVEHLSGVAVFDVRDVALAGRDLRLNLGNEQGGSDEDEMIFHERSRLNSHKPLIGIAKLIELHSHPIHDGKIEAAKLTVVPPASRPASWPNKQTGWRSRW